MGIRLLALETSSTYDFGEVSGEVMLDAKNGKFQSLVLTGDTVIEPKNFDKGDVVFLEVKQDSAGKHSLDFVSCFLANNIGLLPNPNETTYFVITAFDCLVVDNYLPVKCKVLSEPQGVLISNTAEKVAGIGIAALGDKLYVLLRHEVSVWIGHCCLAFDKYLNCEDGFTILDSYAGTHATRERISCLSVSDKYIFIGMFGTPGSYIHALGQGFFEVRGVCQIKNGRLNRIRNTDRAITYCDAVAGNTIACASRYKGHTLSGSDLAEIKDILWLEDYKMHFVGYCFDGANYRGVVGLDDFSADSATAVATAQTTNTLKFNAVVSDDDYLYVVGEEGNNGLILKISKTDLTNVVAAKMVSGIRFFDFFFSDDTKLYALGCQNSDAVIFCFDKNLDQVAGLKLASTGYCFITNAVLFNQRLFFLLNTADTDEVTDVANCVLLSVDLSLNPASIPSVPFDLVKSSCEATSSDYTTTMSSLSLSVAVESYTTAALAPFSKVYQVKKLLEVLI